MTATARGGATSAIRIEGQCNPCFAAVRQALEDNFTRRGEHGSAVCVYFEGSKVVDLWGGHLDAARTRPWRENSIVAMYSIAKSMCALSVHILADRGKVDLDAPVARYWPEFAQAGKDKVLVRHIVSHNCGVHFQDAGKPGDVFDYGAMIRNIERQAPAWEPGTRGGYNTVNIGYLCGEVVRRVTGQRIDTFVEDNIFGPLGADYHIGRKAADWDRFADILPCPNPVPNVTGKLIADPAAWIHRAWKAMPRPMDLNGRDLRLGMVPSFGGYGEARAMARVYAALAAGGTLDGVRLLSPQAVERAATVQWEANADAIFGMAQRGAMGFFRNWPETSYMGPNPRSFGHSGSGGARAFADPDRNLAVCFTCNLQSEKPGTGVRTNSVIEAVFDCVA